MYKPVRAVCGCDLTALVAELFRNVCTDSL